jgi:glutamate formiminotransferase
MTREGFLPDYGPSRLHPTAGAVAVGARRLLVAYNVQLESTDLEVARRIAAAIRERDGGLPGVQALGLRLESRGCVQVSMNLTCLERTNLREAFEGVVRLADALEIGVRDSEIVGLAPRMAFGGATAAELRLPGEVIEYLLEFHVEDSCRSE